jgi:hypothetical protein
MSRSILAELRQRAFQAAGKLNGPSALSASHDQYLAEAFKHRNDSLKDDSLKFFVYANDVCIGWSQLPTGDPPMGVAQGPFFSNNAYEQIRSLVIEHQGHDGTMGEINHELVLAVDKKLASFHFRIIADDGHELHPQAVSFSDFSENVEVIDVNNENPYEVIVLGLPNTEYMHYFSHLYTQYEAKFHREG